MAEELNMSEQAVDAESAVDLSSINTGTNYTTDLGTYSAKPASLDIYKNIVGNPLTGSNPKAKLSDINTASVNPDYDAKLFDVNVQSSKSDYEKMRPYTYNGDVDGANFERYYASDKYKTLGFSPFRDNESLYNNKMTFGDQFVRAASQWDNLAITGFKSGIKSWGTLFTDPLAPDIESAREMKKAMAIGNSNAGGIGGFVTNTFLNSAYTIGIAADFLAEEIALSAITYFSGGLAGEATLPGMAAKAGMASRKLFGFGEAAAKAGKNVAEASKLAGEAETVKKATDNIRGIRNFNDARSFYSSIKAGEFGAKEIALGVGRTLNPFENTLQALEKSDYATSLAKTVKTFGAFADDVIGIKTAVSEAKLEGGMVKIDANKALIDEYKRTHFNQEPSPEELAKIEAMSGEEARRTAFWNLPAIMTSNKLLYATMLAPIRKLAGRGSNVKMLDDILAENPLKANVAGGFTKLGEGFGAKARAAAKSLTKPKIYGQAGMTYLKANFAEGVQENIQEAISKGAINHALDIYRDPKMGAYKGYMAHFMEGMKDQFSAEGAETFAGGFLMGAFAQPIMAAPAWSFTKISKLAGDKSKIEEAKKKRDEAIDKQVKTLNELSTNNIKYFAPDIEKAVRNGKLSDDLYTAVKEGNFKEAKDAQEEIQFNHIITALKTGKYDLFIEQLKDYQNLSLEEAHEAFAKYGISKEDTGKALERMKDVVARAEKIKETYEEVATNYANPFDPTQYEYGSEAYLAAVDSSIAWEKAQQNLVFATNTFQQYGTRLENMFNAFSKLSNNIAKSDAQSLISITTIPNLEREIGLLKDEVKVLGEVPEQAAEKRNKEKKIEILEKFKEELLAADKATDPVEKEKLYEIAKKSFNKYAKYLSKKNNTIVFDKEMDEAFSLLKDGLQIQKERQGLAESINVLSNPKGFFNLQYRLKQAITEHNKEKEKIIKDLFEQFTKLQEQNDAINEVEKETGLKIPADYIAEYKKALDNGEDPLLPTSFIDAAKNEQVTQGPKFDKAIELWTIHLAIIKEKADIEKQEKKEKKVVPVSFDVNKYEEYPDELKAELKTKYDELVKSGDISDETNIEDFATQNPTAKKIVNAYKAKQTKEQETAETSEFADLLNLSIPELQEKYKNILEEFKTNPAVLNEKNKIKQALNYKIRQAINLSPEQKKALDLVESFSKNVVKKDENNNYIINGDKKDTRVTKLVDQILEENFKNYSKFDLFEKTAKPILEAFNKAIKDESLVRANKKEHLNNIFEAIKSDLADNKDKPDKKSAEKLLNEQFNERKLNLLKNELKSNITEDNFKKLFEKYIYEETTIRGNVVDKLFRDYFNGEELVKPQNMSEEAYQNLRDKLIAFDEELVERGELVISKGLTIPGVTTNIVNGKPQTIAGEMDLLVIDNKGQYKIYDMKTSTKWNYFGNESDKSAKKDRYGLQLSLYKNLLENLTGIKVNHLELIAFKTKEDLDGNIISLTEVPNASKTTIDYSKYKDIVNKYVPSKLEVTTAQPALDETTTDAKADIESKGVEKNNIPNYEKIGNYFISMPLYEKDGSESIIVENKKGKKMVYYINTDENGSVISLTPKNNPSQRIINEKLLIAVEIKRNKYDYNSSIINRIAKDEKTYNRIIKLLPAAQVLENTLNLGLNDNITSALNNLYSNKPLERESLIAIQLWVNSAAKRIDSFLQNEYKDNPEFTKAWENLYIINELVLERFNNLETSETKVEEKPLKQGPVKSTEELLKERDEELKFIQEKRKQLGIEFDPLDDVPMSVVITMDRFDNNLPVDPVAISETSDWLYNKYKELDEMLLDPKRLLTQIQIEQYRKALEKDIIALETYKEKQYGKQIIQDEVTGSTDTETGETTGTISRDKKSIKKTSIDEPIKRKAKENRKSKVNKAVKKAAKEGITPENVTNEVPGAEGKEVETAPVDFNNLSIEDKFKTLTAELQPNEQLTGVLQQGAYYRANSESSYHVVLNDGRIIRVVQHFKLADSNLYMIPAGATVTIQKAQAVINGKTQNVIEVLYNGQVLTFVRESTPKNELKKTETPTTQDVSLETLNKNINTDSLKIAKDKNYEVMYKSPDNSDKNGRYMITEVTKNSVSLTGLSGETVKVKTENIANEIESIVDIASATHAPEDIKLTIDNSNAVKKSTVKYEKADLEQLKLNIKDKLC